MSNTINNINLSNLSAEEVEMLMQFAANHGLSAKLKQKASAKKEVDHLQYVDENRNQAICMADENHVFSVNELSEEQLKACKQTGLCPDCLFTLQRAEVIKKKMARTRRFVDNQPSEEKPGYQIREIIKSNFDKINTKLLKKLVDKQFCKATFKLQYALFLDITGKSEDEIAVLKKDAKGHVRYSPLVYNIGKRNLLMTNDLYSKNLEPIREFFTKLG